MHTSTRSNIWVFLIIAGAFISLATYVASTTDAAIAACLIWAAVLFAWLILSTWLFGLRRQTARHLKTPISKCTFIAKSVGSGSMADYTRTFEHLLEREPTGKRFGVPHTNSLCGLSESNIPIQQLTWSTIEDVDGDLVNIPANPVYLLSAEGKPFIAKISYGGAMPYGHEEGWQTGDVGVLEIGALSLADANFITRWLNKQASQHSVYRGKMLLVATSMATAAQQIRISKRPNQKRDEIILAPHIIETLERLVNLHCKNRELLRKHGHSANLGLLLHGEPGTGKTLVTRYLIDQASDHTVIVPSDMVVQTLRECFRLANYLQPSIIVLEDVDLLAKIRDQSAYCDGLQELMNQLDGLSSSDNIVVIMSTNRPDAIEPALASRPGRVAQSMEFPLPGEMQRHALLELFTRKSDATGVNLEEWVGRTSGASPAFIQELCKRSILFASERCEVPESESDATPTQIVLSDEDLNTAIHELVVLGGHLTQRTLGFHDSTAGG